MLESSNFYCPPAKPGVYLMEIIVERPDAVQHLCADKGYAGEPAQQTIKIDCTFRMSNNAEKKFRRRKLIQPTKQEGMWLRLPIHGLTDSESYWYDTKNSLKDMKRCYTWLQL